MVINLKIFLSILLLAGIHKPLFAQELKSTKHGLDLIYGSKYKEEIINEVVFKGGVDETIPVIRFDHVGTGTGIFIPLFIATKEVIPTDSVWLIAIKLDSLQMAVLQETINESNTKIYEMESIGYGDFRITYRFNQRILQYYLLNPVNSTKFFRKIEQVILKVNDSGISDRFYSFLHFVGLISYAASGNHKWNYE
jgi:hypothetical protein